jgi:NET1-associated nuclear protein 1 (U3 small nucleolar RNA-associated protein 17)
VKVLSLKTGEIIYILRGHQGIVTDLSMHPNIRTQFYSSSLDHTIKLWDMNDGTLLQTYQLGKPCLGILGSNTERDILYVLVQDVAIDTGKTWYKVVLFNIRSQKFVGTISKSNTLRCRFDSIDIDGTTAVATVYQRKLAVWWSDKTKVKKINYERPLVTVAIQPNVSDESPIVATGDVEGRILLWYNLLEKPKSEEEKYIASTVDGREVKKTSLHWHAHAVTCMSFTKDGNYLLSGGEEAVLVLWQIGTTNKTFLPRLGAPLCRISVSPDSLSYGITTANNVFRLIDAVDMTVRWSVRGLAAARPDDFLGIQETFKRNKNRSRKTLNTGIAVDPIDGAIALNGVHGTGTLQIYNIFQDSHIATLEVAPRNVVSRTQKEKLAPTTVEHICFSPDGRDLITVDRRTDTHFDDVVSLKFWERSSQPGTGVRYTVNTRVESPHKSYISSVCYGINSFGNKGEECMVVTTSYDCRFKIWTCKRATQNQQQQRQAKGVTIWSCNSTVFFRESPIMDSSFSKDASLLAVGYSRIVTLWNPINNSLLGVLPHASISGKVRKSVFVSGDKSPYLLVVTENQCVIWDVISCDVVWSIECNCTAVGVDFENNGSDARFAIACNSSSDKDSKSAMVLLFDASSSIPIYTWRLDYSALPRHIHFEGNRGNARDEIRLILMNNKKEFYTISKDEAMVTPSSEILPERGTAGGTLTSFNRLFGSKESRDEAYNNRKRKAGSMLNSMGASFTKVFQGASHVLPGLTSLFHPFMESLLNKNNNDIVEIEKESDDMDDENEKSTAAMIEDSSVNDKITTTALNNLANVFSSANNGGRIGKEKQAEVEKNWTSFFAKINSGSSGGVNGTTSKKRRRKK